MMAELDVSKCMKALQRITKSGALTHAPWEQSLEEGADICIFC